MIEGLLQPAHLAVIVVVVLIIFGPGKLPEIGSGIGRTIKDFRKAFTDEEPEPPGEKKP